MDPRRSERRRTSASRLRRGVAKPRPTPEHDRPDSHVRHRTARASAAPCQLLHRAAHMYLRRPLRGSSTLDGVGVALLPRAPGDSQAVRGSCGSDTLADPDRWEHQGLAALSVGASKAISVRSVGGCRRAACRCARSSAITRSHACRRSATTRSVSVASSWRVTLRCRRRSRKAGASRS
jgi:hypothetical protein